MKRKLFYLLPSLFVISMLMFFVSILRNHILETGQAEYEANLRMIEKIEKAKNETGLCGDKVYKLLQEPNASYKTIFVIGGKAYYLKDEIMAGSHREMYQSKIKGSVGDLYPLEETRAELNRKPEMTDSYGQEISCTSP